MISDHQEVANKLKGILPANQQQALKDSLQQVRNVHDDFLSFRHYQRIHEKNMNKYSINRE